MKTLALIVALLTAACCTVNTSRKGEAQFLQHLAESSVLIDTDSGTGSGTVIYSDSKRLLVLTCYHVVESAHAVLVMSPGLGTIEASIEKIDPVHDLALLIVAKEGKWPVVRLASAMPELYSRVWVIGSPVGMWGQITEGLLTKLLVHLPDNQAKTLFRISGAFVYPGISGGTAVDESGKLVCVPSNGFSIHGQVLTQLGFCIALDDIRAFLVGYRI